VSVRVDAAAYSPEADYEALDPTARDVLDCWFGTPGSDEYGKDQKRWFKRSDAFDAMLRERFGASIEAALAHERNAWLATPLGSLALDNPAIYCIPLGFLGCVVGTLLGRERDTERTYHELFVRSETGLGAEGVSGTKRRPRPAARRGATAIATQVLPK